jgi:hypothetical protein
VLEGSIAAVPYTPQSSQQEHSSQPSTLTDNTEEEEDNNSDDDYDNAKFPADCSALPSVASATCSMPATNTVMSTSSAALTTVQLTNSLPLTNASSSTTAAPASITSVPPLPIVATVVSPIVLVPPTKTKRAARNPDEPSLSTTRYAGVDVSKIPNRLRCLHNLVGVKEQYTHPDDIGDDKKIVVSKYNYLYFIVQVDYQTGTVGVTKLDDYSLICRYRNSLAIVHYFVKFLICNGK